MTPVLFFSLSYFPVRSLQKAQNNFQHLRKTFSDYSKQNVFAMVYIYSPGPQAEFHKEDLRQALFPRNTLPAAQWDYWAATFLGLRPVSLTSMFTLQLEHLK